MEQIFGENLIKYKEPEPKEAPEGEAEAPADPDEKPVYYTTVPTAEFFAKEGLEYVLVLFTAKYCPPCEKLVAPLKAFYEEYSKEGKAEMVLVNCDVREKEFQEHLQILEWCHAMPFDASDDLIGYLEEQSNASVIPKIAVFNI